MFRWYDRILLFLLVVILFFCALYLFRGCGGVQLDKDSNPADCGAACGTLLWLGCPEGQGSPGADMQPGTPDDVACVQVCEQLLVGPVGLHPKCVSLIQSCEQISKCVSRGGQ